jgi:hypothetical protein
MWTVYFDETYQCSYYQNNSTFETQWEKPDVHHEQILDGYNDYKFKYVENQDYLPENINIKTVKDSTSSKKSFQLDRIQQNMKIRYDESTNRNEIKHDYLNMAKLYKLYRPYSDPDNDEVSCILCESCIVTDVFFPCHHRCVCKNCIESEQIIVESKLPTNPKGFSNCSLCASVIQLILPFEYGLEVEKYWEWVYEIPIKLPKHFLKEFQQSADIIKAVYIDDKESNNENVNCSEFCSMS